MYTVTYLMLLSALLLLALFLIGPAPVGGLPQHLNLLLQYSVFVLYGICSVYIYTSI